MPSSYIISNLKIFEPISLGTVYRLIHTVLNGIDTSDIAANITIKDPTCYDIDTFRALIIFEKLLVNWVSSNKLGAISCSKWCPLFFVIRLLHIG